MFSDWQPNNGGVLILKYENVTVPRKNGMGEQPAKSARGRMHEAPTVTLTVQ